MEKPVLFKCGKDNVFGIVHVPQDRSSLTQRVGVLFINAGVRYRIGPYRQYVRSARKLCQAGFYSMRFDIPGIGDSDGHFNERGLTSENIDHIVQAIDFFKAETGIERIGLLGLCGGAYMALFSGVVDPRVDFLMLLSLPMKEFVDIPAEGLLRIVLRQYLRRSLRWHSWLNLNSLRGNLYPMLKVLSHLFAYHKLGGLFDGSLWQPFEAYMARGGKALFIFGGNDYIYRAFVPSFGRKLSSLPCRKGSCYEVYVVKEADHIFSQVSWQNKVIEKSISWLKNHFGTS